MTRFGFHFADTAWQTALFNFSSLLLCILLFICTCTFIRSTAPGLVDRNKEGFAGLFWKCSRIGAFPNSLGSARAWQRADPPC